jgi:hypothetical protein
VRCGKYPLLINCWFWQAAGIKVEVATTSEVDVSVVVVEVVIDCVASIVSMSIDVTVVAVEAKVSMVDTTVGPVVSAVAVVVTTVVVVVVGVGMLRQLQACEIFDDANALRKDGGVGKSRLRNV